MSDPFHLDDPWGDFDDVDTEDFGVAPLIPKCLDPFLPSVDPDALDPWDEAFGAMADEISREIDRLILDDLLADGALLPTPTVKPANDLYPHRCPRCGGRAYVGMSNVDCEAKCGA